MFAFALAVWVMLPACGNDTPAAMQVPGTSQAENAAPADKSEKGEKEDEDNKAQGMATANVADAKSATIQNLLTAFAGESTASAKYAAYAQKAEQEGLHQIALLFKAASMSEKIHANNHKSVLEDMGQTVAAVTPQFTVKTTKENLADAITGETYEITTMYPQFLAVAKAVDNPLATISLNYAFKTEQKHKVLYEKAMAALENNQVNTLAAQYFVCPTCGNTYEQTAPKRCGISMTGGERFLTVNSI